MNSLSVVIVCVLLSVATAGLGAENDGSLDSVAEALAGAPSAGPCPLAISATVVRKSDGHYLSFKLTNTSGHSLTFLKQNLPWGNTYSIRFAAVTTEGALLRGGFPIDDDFGHDEVIVAPGQTLSGDYDLSRRWHAKSIPPTGLPPDKVIILMWAYEVLAKELRNRQAPVCSGVTSFRTPK